MSVIVTGPALEPDLIDDEVLWALAELLALWARVLPA